MGNKASYIKYDSPWLIKTVLFFAVIALLINAWLPFKTFIWLNESHVKTQHSRATIESIEAIQTSMVDAETGERGYVITGNPNFLEPYHSAKSRLREQIATLDNKISKYPEQEKSWQEFQTKINHSLEYLQHTVAVRQNEGFAAAVDLVASGEGMRRMLAVRQTANQMRDLEKGLLTKFKVEETTQLDRAKSALVFLTIFDFVMFSLAFWILYQTIGVTRQAELKLKILHDQTLKSGTELEANHNTRKLQTKLVSALQSSVSVVEAYQAIEKFCAHIFPNNTGALYIRSNSKDYYEQVAAWGDHHSVLPKGYEPQDCWAARNGHEYRFDMHVDMPCMHFNGVTGNTLSYICVPMSANGELTGILTVFGKSDADGSIISVDANTEGLVSEIVEQIGLAIANMRLRDSLRSSSILDPLTGLFNRRYLEETLRREISRASRLGKPISIMMLDIDHFKNFNDKYGHDAGDMILCAIAQELKKMGRESDIACRYGGEEFILVLTDADEDVLKSRAETVRLAIKKAHINYGGQNIASLSASFGLALYPTHGLDGATLISAADKALYKAKHSGRDKIALAEILEQ